MIRLTHKIKFRKTKRIEWSIKKNPKSWTRVKENQSLNYWKKSVRIAIKLKINLR